jgi:hypothetical protein
MSRFHRPPLPPRRSCTGPHVFSPWHACGCGQAIADHQDEFFADGSCGFEHRACRFCSAAEERHVSDVEAPTVPDLSSPVAGFRPGGPSAKSSHRAGSPNHQNDSKEDLMVERPGSAGPDEFGGGTR